MAEVDAARRLPALEGLRGVASAVVALRHTVNALDFPLSFRRTLTEGPLAVLLNSDGAVEVFFVLSGFVLAGSVARHGGGFGIPRFFVKRIFRIHPPFVAAVLLAWAVSFLYVVAPADAGLTVWARKYAAIHLSGEALLWTLLFPSDARGQLPVGWTLSWEMLFSLLMPLMFLLARRIHWSLVLGAAIVLPLTVTAFQYVWFATPFALGIVLYLERERFGRWLERARVWWTAPLLVVTLAVFCAPMLLGQSHFSNDIPSYGVSFRAITIMAFGSAGIVLFTLHVGWVRRFFSLQPILYLGRISYGLYLVHMTVITLIAPFVIEAPVGWIDAAALIVLVFAVSIALSHLLYRFVEQPSIRAGNLLNRLLFVRAARAPSETRG